MASLTYIGFGGRRDGFQHKTEWGMGTKRERITANLLQGLPFNEDEDNMLETSNSLVVNELAIKNDESSG